MKLLSNATDDMNVTDDEKTINISMLFNDKRKALNNEKAANKKNEHCNY